MLKSLELYRVAQIRQFEQLAIAAGHLPVELMKRAGLAAFKRLKVCWPKARRIVVFAGKGNNGSDGYMLAALAKAHGLQVSVQFVGGLNGLPPLVLQAKQACQAAGVAVQAYTGEEKCVADVLIDAVFGIGLNAVVKAPYASVIHYINAAPQPVLAIDIPSGIEADTGQVYGEAAVRAEQTVTFIAHKQGLFTGEAVACCGKLVCASLDLPAAILTSIEPAAKTLAYVENDFLPRARNAHKGHFGHVLVVGGNYGMGGAVRLAAEAALRTGAGLVSVATRAEHVAAIVAARPEVMCHAVRTGADLAALMERASVLLIGPGLGRDAWAQDLHEYVLNSQLPKVVDADALNLLAQYPTRQAQWILTPHPGEAGRLLGCTTQVVEADRFVAVERLQARYGGGVVLKGAGSIVLGQSLPCICAAGNPGMASGGMGDVLGGVIAGLLAQGFSLQGAANSGTMLHALAADRAAVKGERGLLALDLMSQLRKLVNVGQVKAYGQNKVAGR